MGDAPVKASTTDGLAVVRPAARRICAALMRSKAKKNSDSVLLLMVVVVVRRCGCTMGAWMLVGTSSRLEVGFGDASRSCYHIEERNV
jgi:hypothetical protein